MKSPQVESYCPDPENYSDLQVMKSPAGWYIGTVYNSPDGYTEPGSRDSQYFSSENVTKMYLQLVVETGDTSILRLHP